MGGEPVLKTGCSFRWSGPTMHRHRGRAAKPVLQCPDFSFAQLALGIREAPLGDSRLPGLRPLPPADGRSKGAFPLWIPTVRSLSTAALGVDKGREHHGEVK